MSFRPQDDISIIPQHAPAQQRHDQLMKARREIAERNKPCLTCGDAIYKHFHRCGDTWVYHCNCPWELFITTQQFPTPNTKTNNAL